MSSTPDFLPDSITDKYISDGIANLEGAANSLLQRAVWRILGVLKEEGDA